MVIKVGCHVSIEGGVSHAVREASMLGTTVFSMWLKNSRGWRAKPYEPAEIERFKNECKQRGYNARTDILPHGSYLINLGNPEEEKRVKSYDAFLDELKRCEALGIGLYNMHPGSSLGTSKEQSILRIAAAINSAHKSTQYVKVVLENMAGDPSRIVGSELTDIARIISEVNDKTRVGVCIDTCHTLAAGWDISQGRGFSAFWKEFDRVIGRQYLSAIHVNDSHWPLGSHRDQHARIGTGFVGPECFRLLMNDENLTEIPKILETSDYFDEVRQLKWFEGKTAMEVEAGTKDLVAKGATMRKENQHKTDLKREKEAKRSVKRETNELGLGLDSFVVKKRKREPKPEHSAEPPSGSGSEKVN